MRTIDDPNQRHIVIDATMGIDVDEALPVYRAAFGGDEEANLVSALATDKTAQPLVSATAHYENVLLAHVLFSRVALQSAPDISAAILCPLAVLPDEQRAGLGSLIVKRGLDYLTENRTSLVFVLGDPNYYGRFGFVPAMPKGLNPPYQLPVVWHDAWMVCACKEGAADGITSGTIKCADALMDEKYWAE